MRQSPSDHYTIVISPGREEGNEMPYAAHCKEWDIWAEHETIPQVLSALFDAIRILEEEFPEKKASISALSSKKKVEFKVPLFA